MASGVLPVRGWALRRRIALLRDSRSHLTNSSNMSAKPSNACPTRSRSLGGIADAGGVVLLLIAQHAMAVATDGCRLAIEGFARDVVKLQG